MRIVPGTPHAQCDYCGKWVKLSGFFAGIHVCLSPEERSIVDQHRALAAQQLQLQARATRRRA